MQQNSRLYGTVKRRSAQIRERSLPSMLPQFHECRRMAFSCKNINYSHANSCLILHSDACNLQRGPSLTRKPSMHIRLTWKQRKRYILHVVCEELNGLGLNERCPPLSLALPRVVKVSDLSECIICQENRTTSDASSFSSAAHS